jgi:hypothetical protein
VAQAIRRQVDAFSNPHSGQALQQQRATENIRLRCPMRARLLERCIREKPLPSGRLPFYGRIGHPPKLLSQSIGERAAGAAITLPVPSESARIVTVERQQ